jgi:GWxTD domain-containing protein
MGARFRFAALLPGLVPLLLGTTGLGTDDDPDGPGPLPWRVRGRVGFTVDAAAFPDSASRSLEVYVRIPPVTLASVRRDSTGAGKLRLSVRLTNRFGARPHEANQEIAFADTVTGFGKVVLLRFPVRPGGYRMRVKLEDLFSQKRGIGYLGRKVTESSNVEGDLTVPGTQAGRDISDLEFVWPQVPEAAGSAFQHGERASLPNPERLYGLLASEMRAEFVAHGPPGSSAPWRWHARVLNGGGNVVAEQESTAAAGPRLSAMVALDLSTEPAGGYELEVKAWQEGDTGALLGTSHFSVGWQSTTWLMDPADMEDVVHFLLSAKEEHLFARLQPGEREQFLDDFWRRRDPTPDTAENEERNAFFARVDYANRNFGGPGLGRGMFSDMGRVFIRYGEPGEVLKQVIPAGDETLAQAIHDLELSEDRPTGDVHQKGLGADTRAYEVWIYQGEITAPPDTDPAVTSNLRARRRLVFLFVDEHGYGDYTLRYSTE